MGLRTTRRPAAGGCFRTRPSSQMRVGRGSWVDGQGGDAGFRSGRAHRLRPGRQHLAAVCRPPTGLISHAADLAPVWTGAEVLVWDGFNIDDTSGTWIDGGRGAAYNPATDRWRQLPRSPLSNRTWAIQAWTGKQLLVISGSCGGAGQIRCQDGAAYDPAANTWTPIPALAGGRLDRQRAGHLVDDHQQARAVHRQHRQRLQPDQQAVAHAPTRPHRSAPTGRARLGGRSAAGLGRSVALRRLRAA
jgi:hypothetical protein